MSELMKRREFITLLGGTAAWPIAAGAQTTALPRRIGVLLVGLSPESKEAKHFRLGLRDAGYSEGRNVVIEWRSANGDYDRLPNLVADLVKRRVDLIVQDSTVGTEVTKRATSTIPIVMALVLDPVGSGLVRSLASPGGNMYDPRPVEGRCTWTGARRDSPAKLSYQRDELLVFVCLNRQSLHQTVVQTGMLWQTDRCRSCFAIWVLRRFSMTQRRCIEWRRSLWIEPA
jgi:ABC transporter substrate binding protein